MADYYVDLQGNVTRNKKKKKKADYSVSLDGTVTQNFQEQGTTIPNNDVSPVKTKTTVEMPSRPNSPRGMESSYAALEEVTRKQVEKTAKEKNLQSNQFDGLTNATYKEYLDNLENNAKDEKQTKWLQTQRENLSIMQDDKVRSYLSTMLPFYLNAENKAAYKSYNEAKAKMKKLGYTDKQIDSLLDTYDRETNAKHSESMSKKADKLTDKGIGGKVAAQVLGIGAGVESAFAGLESVGATVNEKLFGIYSPLDTNQQAFTAGDFKQRVSSNIQKDIEGENPNAVRKGLGVLYQGATGAADSLATAMTFGPAAPIVMAAQAVGSSSKDAFRRTGSNAKATATGLVSGVIEYGTEKMGLDNLWDIMKGSGKAATRSALVNILGQAGIEGAEEATSEALGTIADLIINNADSNLKQNAQKYKKDGKSDKEAWTAAVLDALKEVGQAGLVGAISGGISGSAASAIGMDSFSKNEKKVIDKEVENRISEREKDGAKLKLKEKAEIRKEVEQALKDGDISIDTIESALGGQTFEDLKSYNDQKKALEDEIENFRKMPMSEFTVADSERLRDARKELVDLKKGTNEKQLKERLSQEVSDMTLSDSYIRESYNEKGRRSQAFEADVSKYNAKQQATIQKAIDSKILNNTNKTHKFVDLLAKISADKGVSFDFTDNARIKESGFAVQGATVNGYVKDGNVTLNINSAKALNSVVGHEITHVLEGTEHYAALREAVFEYAKTKKDYDGRLKTLTELYKNVENADVNKELTADLIGDYLFTDDKFVRQLSTQNRNIFQKIYDEIKYLVKTVTSGSKEAKQLEKVKKLFDEVYKESTKTISKDTQYSIAELPDGGKYVNVDTNQDLFVGLDESQSRRKAKEIILERFAGAVIGEKESQPVVATKRTAKEYAYARKRNTSGEKALDKMKASTELDNVLEASQFVEHADYEDVKERHPEAVGGIDTYKTIFKVSEQWYEGIVNVLNCANVRVLYDVTKIKNIGGNELPVSNNSLAAKTNAPINIIPQNQKKSTENQKYSLVDSNGKQLSKMQVEYFKDSQVRDENGALIPVYHGTKKGGFTIFESSEDGSLGKGIYFAESKEYAKGIMYPSKDKPYMCYLNIKNPYVAKYPKQYNQEELIKQGYDGIHATGPRFWVAFYPNQIKEVTNERPTMQNDDIRYSLSNDDIAPIGNWNVKGSDLALEGVPIRQDIAPAQQQDAAEQTQHIPDDRFKNNTVKDSNILKMENYQKELSNIRRWAHDSYISFNEDIAKKQKQYADTKNKNTQAAQKLLASIERLKTQRDNVQIEYGRRENRLQEKINEIRYAEDEETKFSRKEFHKGIIDNISKKFEENGFDFDAVLQKAKNKSTWSSVDNTPQRFMEKTLGYKEGQILSDLTVNQTAQNETKAIRWLNSYTDRKNGFLAQISKQYGIKPKSKESAAAQMYGEGFYVNEAGDLVKYGDAELAKDFPDPNVQKNIKELAKDPRIRQVYDDTLNQINESRVRNGYPEIPKRKDYFLHFRAMEDTFSRLGLPFNPNDIKAKDLPTDINGVTADLKPGQPYFASAQRRVGNRTTYDLLGGLERYLGSAKNQIYHIDDIQTLRALRNYIADTYGQAKGLESLDDMSEEEAAQRIEQVYDAHLSTFAKFLNEQANTLAGKTSLIDRGLEGIIGRKGITFLDTVNKQVGSNMVGVNISSSLTNLVSVVQGFAKVNKYDFTKAFTQTVANKISSIKGKSIDNFTEENPLVVRRKGSEKFTRTPYETIKDAGYIFAGAIDDFSTEVITRAKYNELTRKGMDSYKAHIEADKWASRILGDRSYGQQPQLYNSKMLGLLTKFQLEVRNQLDSMFYDTIREAQYTNEEIQNGFGKNAKIAAKVGSTFLQLAIGQHIFGQVFESIAGYNPTFDIIEVLATALGLDDEEESEDTVLDNLEQGFLALVEDLPYTSTFTGGRIPIASALPIEELITGKDQYGNEKSRLETLGEALPYYILPTGYGQGKKTLQGLKMFDNDLPVAGSYTDSGKLRFPVEETPLNVTQAAAFGQYASENARDYFDNNRSPLSDKQLEEFLESKLPIKEYWDYREGLKGKKKLQEKADYIAGLDIPISTKNVLINNQSRRKEEIDLTDYDLFETFEEFDYATKNPEKYAVSKVAGGYKSYKKYTKTLSGIVGNKDGSGNPISGSRKQKVLNYIKGLEISQAEKMILFRQEYTSDNRYNGEIIDYLSGRNDISYQDKIAILKELGFTVDKDGTVRW